MDSGFSTNACDEQGGALVFGTNLTKTRTYELGKYWSYNFKDFLTCSCRQEDGTCRVFVIGARGAHGLELPIASEVFEESGRSLVRGTLDYLQGLKVVYDCLP